MFPDTDEAKQWLRESIELQGAGPARHAWRRRPGPRHESSSFSTPRRTSGGDP